MISKSRLLLGLPAAALCAATMAVPAKAQPAPAAMENSVTSTATVESIDHKTRQVVLNEGKGDLVTVVVGPAVQNFDKIEAGDHIVMTYQEAVAAELAPPGKDLPPPSGQTVAMRAAKGQLPAGATYTVVDVNVKITSVDKKTNVVNYTRADGSAGSLAVKTPKMQKFIAGLKPGDNVEVEYLQALTLQVEKGS